MARVYTSSVINAAAARVWERVRGFNDLPRWHPLIRDSRIEDALPADKVGCIRNFNLQNGDNIREQLLGLSDYDMFCTYSILISPMPLEDYIATLRLTPPSDSNAENFNRAQMHEALSRILNNEREHLRSLFNQAPGFVAVLMGPKHVFEMVNEAYYQLVGHRELIGKAVWEALPEVAGPPLRHVGRRVAVEEARAADGQPHGDHRRRRDQPRRSSHDATVGHTTSGACRPRMRSM